LPFWRLEWKGESKGEEHESGEVFEEGWMLGIETHIAVAHIAVGSRNMRLFIVGHRFLARD